MVIRLYWSLVIPSSVKIFASVPLFMIRALEAYIVVKVTRQSLLQRSHVVEINLTYVVLVNLFHEIEQAEEGN